jgi:hypothetical protein
MTQAFRLASFGLALSALICACNFGNVAADHLYPACQPPPGVQVAMVYPAPDATAVPTTFSEVVFASNITSAPPEGLAQNELAYLIVSNASPAPLSPLSQSYLPVGTATISPSAVPTPNALASTPAYLQASVSTGITWPNNVTISVYLGAHNGSCNPYTYLGSFTTQTAPPTASPSPTPSPSPSPTPTP